MHSKHSEQKQYDSFSTSLESTPQEVDSFALNKCVESGQTHITQLEKIARTQKPWSLYDNLLVDFLIDIAVYIQESSNPNEIEEFDLQYACRNTIKTRNLSEINTYELVNAFVRLIETKSISILVPCNRQTYSFVNDGLQNYFTSLNLVRQGSSLNIEAAANRFLHYMTDSRYQRPLLMALEYIFSKWTVNNADLFFHLLAKENQQLPLGSILLIIALPQLLHCMPSSTTINTAFDLFMQASIVQKWLVRFPILMKYFNIALNHLPSDLASQWIVHYLDTHSDPTSISILVCIFLQNIHHQHGIPSFFTSAHYKILRTKLTIDDDIKTPIDRLLVAISVFDATLIPKNELSSVLSTDEITNMSLSRLALIIALNGGLYRREQQKVAFSSKNTHRNCSISFSQLLNNDAHWFESIIEQKNKEDDSQDIVDIFVAWICLVGVERPWIYEKFAKWPAFHRAIARFRRIGLYLNECYVLECAEYNEFSEASPIKNITTKILEETNSISLARSITIALARLILPNGKYSFFLKDGSNSSIVRLLDLPLPIQLLSDINNPNRELLYLFPLLFPMFPQSYLLVNTDDRMRKDNFYTIDFLLNFARRHQTSFLLSLISKPVQALYASLLDDGTLSFVILLVEIGIQLVQKRKKGGVYYSLVLALIKNEYDKHNLCNYYRGLVCLCTIRSEARDDFVQFDKYISGKEQRQVFRQPLEESSKRNWLLIELAREYNRIIETSDIDFYVNSVSLAILCAATDENDKMPLLYVNEVKDRISFIQELPLRLHALTVFQTFGLTSTSDEFDSLNNMTLSLLPSFEVPSIGLHAWLFLSWLFAFPVPDNLKTIRSGLKLILDRLDTNIDQDSILVQQATCESLFSLNQDEYPNVRSRIYQIVKRSLWSNDTSAVSRIFHIDSNPFLNSTVNWNLLNAEQATLVASMYLVQLSVDVHKLSSWFEKPRELDRDLNDLHITRLIHECSNDHRLSEKAELAINNLLSSRDAKDGNAREALWIHTFKKPWPMGDSNDSSADERRFLDESEYIQTNPAFINNPFIIIQMCYLMLHCDNDIFYREACTHINVGCFYSSKLRIQGLIDLFHLVYKCYRIDSSLIQKLFSEIDLRIDEEEHVKVILDWERARIAAVCSMNCDFLELNYGLKLNKQDLTRSLLQCIRADLATQKTKATFFQLANQSVLTLVVEPEYLTELVLYVNRYWIHLKFTRMPDDEQQLVFSLMSIFNRSPPLLQKAIVQALIPNRSIHPYIPFGTLHEARQFIKDFLIKAAKGPLKIDEEVLALMVQHYYHHNEDDDESLLMKLTICSWSKTVSQAADMMVVQLYYSTPDEPTLDDLVAIFHEQYLPLYYAMMFVTNHDLYNLNTWLAASELIRAHADDLLILFVGDLYSSLNDHTSSRSLNYIQVAIALLDKIPTELRLAIKKHNDNKDQRQEKFKCALLTMSEQFNSNSCQSFELLIMLYGELTLEISNIFLTAAKCPLKQMIDFCDTMQHIKHVNCRDVVEHLHERLATSLSLQQRYVAACLLVQLAKHDQVSIREVQRVLVEAMNDQRAIDDDVIITNNSEKTEEKERLGKALSDLLLELSFLSSSLSSSSSQDMEQSLIKFDTNNFNWEFKEIIGADGYASCILVGDHPPKKH